MRNIKNFVEAFPLIIPPEGVISIYWNNDKVEIHILTLSMLLELEVSIRWKYCKECINEFKWEARCFPTPGVEVLCRITDEDYDNHFKETFK